MHLLRKIRNRNTGIYDQAEMEQDRSERNHYLKKKKEKKKKESPQNQTTDKAGIRQSKNVKTVTRREHRFWEGVATANPSDPSGVLSASRIRLSGSLLEMNSQFNCWTFREVLYKLIRSRYLRVEKGHNTAKRMTTF